MNIKGALELAWCTDTCYPGDRNRYLISHPSTGQCAVTALLIQDIFGGKIVKCARLDHYFNLINEEEFDFTRGQFPDNETIEWNWEIDREDLLGNIDTKERYYILRQRFNFRLFNL